MHCINATKDQWNRHSTVVSANNKIVRPITYGEVAVNSENKTGEPTETLSSVANRTKYISISPSTSHHNEPLSYTKSRFKVKPARDLEDIVENQEKVSTVGRCSKVVGQIGKLYSNAIVASQTNQLSSPIRQ